MADLASRSVRVLNLAAGSDEGLLQQAVERVASGVKRVEIFQDVWEAVIEFESATDAGRLLLSTDGLTFDGVKLNLVEEGSRPKPRADLQADAAPAGTSKKAGASAFIPRAAKATPKTRMGLGYTARTGGMNAVKVAAATSEPGPSSRQSKDQDAFRAMLGSKM